MTTVITRDGKAVVLHDDGTWTYAAVGGSTVERLKALSVPPAIADTVKGLFTQLGVRVIDTGEAFTCVHRGEHVVVPGRHGTPLRVLRVPFADAVDLQTHLCAGMKAGLAPAKWLAIATWYLGWRKRVEVPA